MRPGTEAVRLDERGHTRKQIQEGELTVLECSVSSEMAEKCWTHKEVKMLAP